MNYWTQASIELANQRDYLDQLFRVYPMSHNLNREMPERLSLQLQGLFDKKDNKALIKLLLQQELFPVKDSYVAYLKRDSGAVERNPQTINRLAGAVYDLGYDEMIKKMTMPKETNRQIGPLFKNWIRSKALGFEVTEDMEYFRTADENLVLNASDAAMEEFARKYLGYDHNKGLDFIAKVNGTYVIGEAKFLTDFGGHQNAQFADAIATLRTKLKKTPYIVKKIAILDGVLYIPGKHKMMLEMEGAEGDEVIISALLLRDYLYTL